MPGMDSLRTRLAAHGFESNDDYDFHLRCLLDTPTSGARALNIAGDGDRRKTAFATALARALDIPRIGYHDFTARHPPPPEVILPPSQDELGRVAVPIEPLDQTVSEACAQSEGGPTVLILDQLQAADFREHLRIFHLISRGDWRMGDARHVANLQHLLVFLISEEPLYHALHKASFRVWIGPRSERLAVYRPEDFGFDAAAQGLFAALAASFDRLGSAPTPSEFALLLNDLRWQVRTLEHLRISLFGRIEGIERGQLQIPAVSECLEAVVEAAQTLFIEEHIEARSP